MSRPPGNTTGSDVARGASFAAAKGVLLIGLAVVIGIVLLQQVDNDNKRPVGAATPGSTKAKAKTTTTGTPPAPTTTVTTPSPPAKTPQQLRVIVLNGGAAAGAAAQMSTQLMRKQYTKQDKANNWSGHKQQGTTPLCKTRLD